MYRRLKHFGTVDLYSHFVNTLAGMAGGPFENVLDAGCGEAFASISLASTGMAKNVTLLDRVEKTIRENENKLMEYYPGIYDRFRFEVKDLNSSPVDGKYDLVMAMTLFRPYDLRPGHKKTEHVFDAVSAGGSILVTLPLVANGIGFESHKNDRIRGCIEERLYEAGISPDISMIYADELWTIGKRRG
jgi:tRNA A58 N-methylase Trm61